MSKLGWARRISHWFFGGRNASHVGALPFSAVEQEFPKLASYLKIKRAELPANDQNFFIPIEDAFENLRSNFKKFDFKSFPKLKVERDIAKSELISLTGKVAPYEQRCARLDDTNAAIERQVKTIKSSLLFLGKAVLNFQNSNSTDNIKLAAEVCNLLAPLVHSIANEAEIDLDESSFT